jgi:hypothetical protein
MPMQNKDSVRSELYIVARPWAEIFVDSMFYETTPLSAPIIINPGDHLIELKNPNYQTYTKIHKFKPAAAETLTVDLKLNVGFLNILVLPWADVHVNGNYQVTTPLENPIRMPAGMHIVSLVNPNFTTITDTIKILAGQTINKKFTMIR